MLTYSMDEREGLSLYEYLYKCIKQDILVNELVSGQKLPSKRSLAKNLGVSVITIENAYSQLQAEGFISSIEKKGYYVSDLSKWNLANHGKTQDEICEIEADEGKKSSNSSFYVDFVSNNVNYEKFPFSQWSKLTRKVLADGDEDLLKAAPPTGVYQLREAIREYLYHFRGVVVDVEQIVVGSGTEYLYGILIQLLGRDGIYALEDPGYSKVYRMLKGNGVKCVHMPIDQGGMCVEGLNKEEVSIVHLTPAHHFPTGVVMPIQRRLEFLMWASEQESRYIIEDDYDCEFRLQGRPIQTLFESDHKGHVIYMNTFSKTIAPSFRISYMVLPRHLIGKFEEKLGYISCTVPNLEQYVLAEFIQKGYFERHINRMRVFYRMQRDQLMQAIRESVLGEFATIQEENSGLHFLLKIRTYISDEELKIRAKEVGVQITCLTDYSYSHKQQNEHIIILNYSGIRTECIKEAVNRLGTVVANLP